ncbi:MAG: T9SS type A sorting domain-containing protein [Saprospiraceae bacterium]
MKRILTLLLAIVFCAFQSYAQYDILDFESAAGGTGLTWIVDQNGTNPALAFPANPVSGGINTTATVAQFDAEAAGQTYALTYTTVNHFEFDGTNTTIKIKVYKPYISDVGIKFEGGSSGAIEIKVPNTVTNQWEELTFDFSGQVGNNYATMVIIPDFIATGPRVDHTLYFDDIQIPTGNYTPLTGPTTAAPTPTHTVVADNVLSIYSDAYTDVSGTDFNPNWGQATAVTTASPGGNDALKYTGLNYQGTQFASTQDVSGHGYIHVDYYTDDATALSFFLINTATSPATEKAYTFTVTTGQWVSVDIPLNHFVDLGLDITNIGQFKVTGNGTIYFDNWYFHSTYFASTPVGPASAAPTPTHDEVTDNVISIYSDAYTDVTGTNFNPNWGQATTVTTEMISGNATLKYAALNYQGTQLGASQDVSALDYIHLDFWTNNSTTLNFYLISSGPVEAAYSLTITADQWVSVDIPLTSFGAVNLADIIQFKIDGNGTIWFDNFYFHSGTPVPVELSYFNAKAENNSNVLSWETATELNNSHFEVERSFDGINFEVIETVEGNGTTVEVINYEFVDEAPLANTYYRLRQVDFDGQFEYSKVVSVNRKVSGSGDVKVYPNPAQDNLTIDFTTSADEDVIITVTDMTGRVLISQNRNVAQGENQLNIDLTNLPQGNYFLQLKSTTTSTIQAIVKQ